MDTTLAHPCRSAWNGRRARCSALVFVLASLAAPQTLRAQALRGVVIDDDNGTPVASATVRLVVRGELDRGTETDAQGRFLFTLHTAGDYGLEVSRVGYTTTRSQSVRVEDRDTVSIEFRILPDAVVLSPITVTARSLRGRDTFERRRTEWGRGVFLDQTYITLLEPDHPAEALDGIEDVDLRWVWGATHSGMGRLLPTVRSVRGRGCMLYMVDFVPVQADLLNGASGWSSYILDNLQGRDVVAVEVYRSVLEVPQELQRYTYTLNPTGGAGQVHCGLVVFWTRAGW